MPDPLIEPLPAIPGDLLAYGWTAHIAEGFRDVEGAPARVARVDRGSCLLATTDGLVRAAPPATPPHPVTGDWVALRGDPPTIQSVLPRTTALVRRDPSGTRDQVLAANIDTVFVVCGLDRPLRSGRLERALLIVWESGATPVLVLTKADLADESTKLGALAIDAAAGVEVHLTSSVDGSGIQGLQPFLGSGQTVALLGESGAGKSTLVNALVGTSLQATAAVREGDAKGRHTTTARELIPLPGGGVLLDTPGVRELGVVEAADALALTFPEVEELAAACRFRDCAHEHEPGCAVTAALAAGDLEPERFARYGELQRELAFEARKRDARARNDARRENRRRAR